MRSCQHQPTFTTYSGRLFSISFGKKKRMVFFRTGANLHIPIALRGCFFNWAVKIE
jgi:hypothetical protein